MDKRTEHLNQVAEDYNVDPFIVDAIADILGESEDFDGLISAVEDFNELYG